MKNLIKCLIWNFFISISISKKSETLKMVKLYKTIFVFLQFRKRIFVEPSFHINNTLSYQYHAFVHFDAINMK